MPEYTRLPADGIWDREPVSMTLDEYEAIRLMDLEGLTHEECARVMQISRTTATEIYASARRKAALAIVEGRAILIAGGNVRLCERSGDCAGFRACARQNAGLNRG